MTLRTLIAAIVCLALVAPAHATSSLTAQVFPLSGEVRLRETSGTAVPFVYSSVKSNSLTSGALNSSPAIWKSITDNYDLSGNGFIDPITDWAKLSATSTQLTEGVFTGTGSLPAWRSVSFGTIWNPNIVPYTDLGFSVFQSGMVPVTISVVRAVAGDYNGNLTVDSADYQIWQQSFGSTTSLDADGDLSGVVDAADYVIWLQNFGNFIPAAVGGLVQLEGAVPEPGSALLLGMGGGFFALTSRVRARRTARSATPRRAVRP